MKIVFRLFALVLAGAIAYVIYLAVLVWRDSHLDQYHPAGAIVVLGAAQYNGTPSPVLRARLAHALYLYRQELSRVVITTGGKQPGDRYTEAGTGATWLEQNGVPADAILSENTGRNTWQSLTNVAAIARAHGIDTILMVSDPLHSARLKAMASALGFRAAYTSPDSYLDLHRSRLTKLEELVHEVAALAYFQVYERWTG